MNGKAFPDLKNILQYPVQSAQTFFFFFLLFKSNEPVIKDSSLSKELLPETDLSMPVK